MPDESWKGSGTCTNTYKGGDKNSLTWEEGSHLKDYTYTITGGTGKYQGATGGGTYIYENLTDTLSGGTYKETIQLIGDHVYTLSGESKPSKWIGHQRFTRNAGSAWPKSVLPVRVSRFALDEQTPQRDLYVSPNHALLLDGVLIPAIYLVNGTSIVQAMPEGVEEIDYFHIELETHEIVFAEGAAAETLLVIHDHHFADLTHDKFDNFAQRERLCGK